MKKCLTKSVYHIQSFGQILIGTCHNEAVIIIILVNLPSKHEKQLKKDVFFSRKIFASGTSFLQKQIE